MCTLSFPPTGQTAGGAPQSVLATEVEAIGRGELSIPSLLAPQAGIEVVEVSGSALDVETHPRDSPHVWTLRVSALLSPLVGGAITTGARPWPCQGRRVSRRVPSRR